MVARTNLPIYKQFKIPSASMTEAGGDYTKKRKTTQSCGTGFRRIAYDKYVDSMLRLC